MASDQKRDAQVVCAPSSRRFFARPLSVISLILLALGIGGGILAIAGINPFEAYQTLFKGALWGKTNFSESLLTATPLIMAGLGVLFAFRAGIWNIGAEGQIAMGTLGATVASVYFPMPAPWHIFVVAIVGALFGAVWALIPAILKAQWGINEILTTLMMNYVAIWLVHYAVYGPIRDSQKVMAQSADFPASAWYPILVPGTRLHIGFIVSLVAVIGTFLFFRYTRLGYSINVLGSNAKAAKFGGISAKRTVIVTMLISGGLCGLAGMGEMVGLYHFLQDGVSRVLTDYGYVAIGVTLLGGLTSVGTLIAGIFFWCVSKWNKFLE